MSFLNELFPNNYITFFDNIAFTVSHILLLLAKLKAYGLSEDSVLIMENYFSKGVSEG